ncbi:DUF1684 domain-containing protein [Bacteroidota bacterium]
MKNSVKHIVPVLIMMSIIFTMFGCQKNYTPKEEKYISEIEKERLEKDEYMRDDPNSPFNYKSKIEFHPLKYFDVDPAWVFTSKLYEYEVKDTVSIFGTKGEERKSVRYGNVSINYENQNINMHVYQSAAPSGLIYYSIWFTDQTTNKETYGVGRYLDFELVDDPEYEYTLDFNKAYNPYCAYSPEYSCAIPTKEDYINIPITAGEKKFHD